jgi:hypothetical protein
LKNVQELFRLNRDKVLFKDKYDLEEHPYFSKYYPGKLHDEYWHYREEDGSEDDHRYQDHDISAHTQIPY